MDVLIVILIAVLIGAVVLVVGGPLRAAQASRLREEGEPAGQEEAPEGERLRHDDLEAAREAKYREIRDAELDYRTGKLSAEDYQTVVADLRAEALTILDSIERPDEAGGETPSS